MFPCSNHCFKLS